MIGPWWISPQPEGSRYVDHDFRDDYPGADTATCLRCGLRWRQTEYLNGGGCGATTTRDRFTMPDGTDGWRDCRERERA